MLIQARNSNTAGRTFTWCFTPMNEDADELIFFFEKIWGFFFSKKFKNAIFWHFKTTRNFKNTNPFPKILSPMKSWDSWQNFGASLVSWRFVKVNVKSHSKKLRKIFKNRFLAKINRNFYVVFQCISQISSFLQKIIQNYGNFKRSKTSTFTKRQKLRPVPMKSWNSQLHIGERIFSIGAIFFTFAGGFKFPEFIKKIVKKTFSKKKKSIHRHADSSA